MTDAKIGDEAVERATGRRWSEWHELLDAWGGAEKGHTRTARHLSEEHGLSGWWSQMVTVHYERSRGLREVGETASGAYQVGVRRTVDLAPEAAWERVFGPDGLAVWLGAGAPDRLAEGLDYALDDGTAGEVRVVREGSYVRLTWQPPEWDAPSTLQVRVSEAASGRATIGFHHEGLRDQESREAMRAHWRGVLDRLVALGGPG
jgi:uncharacterized protein YndB with AHSA1/START domain